MDKDYLWDEFKDGNKEAFSEIFKTYFKLLFRYCQKFSNNLPVIEDCIQDLFLGLWKNRESLGETDSIKFYLLRSIRRKLARAIRKNREVPIDQTEWEFLPFNIQFSFEHEIVSKDTSQERKERLSLALKSLTKRQKEAIYLKFYCGLNYDEIAQLMSMSVKSAYNLIYRGIKDLRRNLGNKMIGL